MTFTGNPVRNGADTVTLFATLGGVKGDPGAAKFRSRATNTWVSGPTTARASTASTWGGRTPVRSAAMTLRCWPTASPG